MEMIKISKEKYERMLNQISILREIEKIDINLVRQFNGSLEDVKAERITRVA